jgi:hypothetical protein
MMSDKQTIIEDNRRLSTQKVPTRNVKKLREIKSDNKTKSFFSKPSALGAALAGLIISSVVFYNIIKKKRAKR